MEKRDLYDSNRKLTGETIFKGEKVPSGKYIMVVLSFIENLDGKFLIQKTSKQKGNVYASTGGHPKSGEDSITGMITEISEEIGLNVEANELNFVYSDIGDDVIFDLYYIKKDFDLNSLVLQESEVESVSLFTIEEIKDLIDKGLFRKSHAEAFYKVLDWLNK